MIPSGLPGGKRIKMRCPVALVGRNHGAYFHLTELESTLFIISFFYTYRSLKPTGSFLYSRWPVLLIMEFFLPEKASASASLRKRLFCSLAGLTTESFSYIPRNSVLTPYSFGPIAIVVPSFSSAGPYPSA